MCLQLMVGAGVAVLHDRVPAMHWSVKVNLVLPENLEYIWLLILSAYPSTVPSLEVRSIEEQGAG
jgi:hypothetical protein